MSANPLGQNYGQMTANPAVQPGAMRNDVGWPRQGNAPHGNSVPPNHFVLQLVRQWSREWSPKGHDCKPLFFSSQCAGQMVIPMHVNSVINLR